METKKFNLGRTPQAADAREVGRIEVGRYVRLYDLSSEEPRLIFELMERPAGEAGTEPAADTHVSEIIDFFERLAKGDHHGN